VKVHGLLRTGTNYISTLLGENLEVLVLGPEKGGWKHGPIETADNLTFVVVVKDPYTWMDSFYRWELLRGRTTASTVGEFAVAPLSHDRLAGAWGARDPIDVWNIATAGWIEAGKTGNVLVVRYEDVIADFARELDRFSERFPTKRRHGSPVDIETRVGPGWKTVGPVNRDAYVARPPEERDAALVELLAPRLDRELMRHLDYVAEG
jgi:hypothetical protein